MARMTKKQSAAIFYLVVVVVVFGLIVQFFEAVGFAVPAAIVIAGIAIYYFVKNQQKQARHARLMQKYDDASIVDKIMEKSIWQGQTEDQLLDSLGKPAGVDQKILKTKKKEVWKYGHQGANRYSTRITLENDVVIGWDVK